MSGCAQNPRRRKSLLAVAIIPEDTSKAEKIGAGAIALLAFLTGVALRWIGLGQASLWYDEGYTAWIVSHPMGEIIRLIRNDTAPPLYYLILRAWVNCFGHGEAGLRSLAAVISTIALFLFYPLALKLLRDRLVASLALLLFAVSLMQVEHAREARFYSMMTLLAELSLLLVLRVLDKPSLRTLLAMMIVWALSLYTNNMMAFWLAGLGVCWLVFPGKRTFRARIMDATIVSLGAAILYLPWLPTAIAQAKAIEGHFWTPPATIKQLAHTIIALLGINHFAIGSWNHYVRIFISIFLIVLLAGILLRQTSRRTVALIAVGLLPVLIAYVYSQGRQSILVERSFIPSTIAIPILLVMPLIWLRRAIGTWTASGLSLLWIIPAVLSLQPHHLTDPIEDWREACAQLQNGSTHPQLVVFIGNEGVLLYDYYARAGDYSPHIGLTGAPSDFFAADPPRTMQRVQDESDFAELKLGLAEHANDEVALVYIHPWFADSNHLAQSFFGRKRPLINVTPVKGIDIYRWGAESKTPKLREAATTVLPAGE